MPPGHRRMCLTEMRDERELDISGLSISVIGKDITQTWKNLGKVVHGVDVQT